MKNALVFFFLISIFACKNASVTESTATAVNNPQKCNIYPLSDSSYWIYSTTHYKSDGSVEEADEDSIHVLKTQTFNSNKYFFLNPYWFRNKDCQTIAAYDPILNKEFDIKNNCTTNDSLAINLPYSSSPCRAGVKVFYSKERAMVKGINCYKLSFDITLCTGVLQSSHTWYIGEGVGMVKAELYQYTSSGKKYLQTKQELLRHNVQDELLSDNFKPKS